ncbi:MAG: ABC transporter permease [Opitutaceae bacterium]|jgi:ABC-2 type transport system permease protein|nr:ABC transporter permease [Opitutaceae bacterium]
MRHFFTLLRAELWKLLINPSTYIAAFLFLLIMGFLFQLILLEYANDPKEESPSVTFFKLFFVPVFFMVPLLTMRSVAEERASGTIETLMTVPVTATEVILSKFCAGYIYYTALWAFTGSFHYLFFSFVQEDSIFDPYPIIGGYAYIAISGTLFLSLGIFASTMTRSQLIAGIVSFSLVFGFIVIGSYLDELALLWISQPAWVDQLAQHTDVIQHSRDFSSGIIDTRAIVLYASCSLAFLFLSILVLEYREGGA